MQNTVYAIFHFFATSAPHEPILGVTAPLIDCRRILMICIGLSNAFAINLIMFHQISVVFIMKDKISKFWSISVPRCGSLVVRALGTLPGRSLVRSRVWLLCKKNVNNSWDFISMCGLGQTTAWRAFQKNSNRG